jgi:thiosulfate reductase cytochrome b subunit
MSATALPAARRAPGAMVRVTLQHHVLVRVSHWINVPLLLGMIASGLAIHWASPVLRHPYDAGNGTTDVLGDVSVWIARLLGARDGDPRLWIYDHLSLGTQQLAVALRVHWALAYLFMANGALWIAGLAASGAWRALLPRPSDAGDALRMMRFYAGALPMAVLRRPWPHPRVTDKYNALQRGAYATVAAVGALEVLSGWAMHKPVQLAWLERLFVDYDGARVVHFAGMVVLGLFVVPHVLLAAADGWDTCRSMVVGWSARVKEDA